MKLIELHPIILSVSMDLLSGSLPSDNAKLGSEDSDIINKAKGSSSPKQVGTMLQVSESQALMKNCLSEFNIK